MDRSKAQCNSITHLAWLKETGSALARWCRSADTASETLFLFGRAKDLERAHERLVNWHHRTGIIEFACQNHFDHFRNVWGWATKCEYRNSWGRWTPWPAAFLQKIHIRLPQPIGRKNQIINLEKISPLLNTWCARTMRSKSCLRLNFSTMSAPGRTCWLNDTFNKGSGGSITECEGHSAITFGPSPTSSSCTLSVPTDEYHNKCSGYNLMFGSGSAQRTSQSRPVSGTSVGRKILPGHKSNMTSQSRHRKHFIPANLLHWIEIRRKAAYQWAKKLDTT